MDRPMSGEEEGPLRWRRERGKTGPDQGSLHSLAVFIPSSFAQKFLTQSSAGAGPRGGLRTRGPAGALACGLRAGSTPGKAQERAPVTYPRATWPSDGTTPE